MHVEDDYGELENVSIIIITSGVNYKLSCDL